MKFNNDAKTAISDGVLFTGKVAGSAREPSARRALPHIGNAYRPKDGAPVSDRKASKAERRMRRMQARRGASLVDRGLFALRHDNLRRVKKGSK